MATAAGLDCLWNPPATAGELQPLVVAGLDKLRVESERLKQMNPPNKWGSYYDLLSVASQVKNVCEQLPTAVVEADK